MQNSELNRMPKGKVDKFKTPTALTLCALDEAYPIHAPSFQEFIKKGQIIPVTSKPRYARVLERGGFTKEQLAKLYLVPAADPTHDISKSEEWIHKRSLNDTTGAQIKGAGQTSTGFYREQNGDLLLPYSPKEGKYIWGGLTVHQANETYRVFNALHQGWFSLNEHEPQLANTLNATGHPPFARPVAVFIPLKILATKEKNLQSRVRRVNFSTLLEKNQEIYEKARVLLVKGSDDTRRIYQIAEKSKNYTLTDYRHLARVAKSYGLNFTAAHLTRENNRRKLHEVMQDRLLAVYRTARGHSKLAIGKWNNVLLDGKDFTGTEFFDTSGVDESTPSNKYRDEGTLREFDAILADALKLPLTNRRRIEQHPQWQKATRN